MPMKNIYVPDGDLAAWDEITKLAKRHRTSASKLILGEMKRFLRERQSTGLPLGFTVPASMKDPRVLRAEQTADRIRAQVLDALLSDEDAES